MEKKYITFWSVGNDKVLKINLSNEFRTKWWAENLGKLYFYIKSNSVNEIIIHGENVSWIDPIPLMSLIVFIKQYTCVRRENFKIYFYNINKRTLNEREMPFNILLKFLLEEGFLDILNECAIINNNDSDEKYNFFKNIIKGITIPLHYFDCHLLNGKVFEVNEIIEDDKFYQKVNDIIEEIRVNILNKKIPPYHVNDILYKIRNFFSETIKNVHQHAYPNETKKYLGIYARYRYGMKNDSIDKSQLQRLLTLELRNSSHLASSYKEILDYRDGCIELFIVDAGIGIAKAMGFREPNKNSPITAYTDVFNISKERLKSTDKSQTLNGGLYIIGQHIGVTSDYIIFKDLEYWFGGILPDIKTGAALDLITSKENNHIPGCILHASFSWHPEKMEIKEWNRIDKKLSENLLPKYAIRHGYSESLESFVIIDERITTYFNDRGRKQFIRDKFSYKTTDTGKKRPREQGQEILAVIYLPHRGMTKHKLAFLILPQIIQNLSKETTLIIADIPDEERIIYYEALNVIYHGATEVAQQLKKIKQIILISNSLSICAFEIDNNKIRYDEDEVCQLNFLYGRGKITIANILEILINYDSFLIWDEVKSQKDKNIFICSDTEDKKNPKIYWNEEEYITAYLDFNQLSLLPVFTKLFQIGINRFIGLFHPNEPIFHNLDILVANLVTGLKVNYHYKGKRQMNLDIGSVYVRGITLKENENQDPSLDKINIHCFQNPSLTKLNGEYSQTDNILKLFFWPNKKWIDESFSKIKENYKRIGHTSAIAPGGWQFFPVPRYKEDNSFYYLTPKETYLIWQNPELGLRLGHFKYGKHIDLIKVNIKAFVEKSFLEKSDLAKFLVANFYFALGGNNVEMQILDPDYRKIDDKLRFGDYYASNAVIVYPNHISNSIIFEKINEILHPDLTKKIIPLNYIRNDSSVTNHIFSPLNFGTIKQYINTEKHQVLFFDDVVMSGRTRKEAKHLLFSFGVSEVKTLAIFDRQRLPFLVPNPQTNKFFARLDIPRLGTGNSKISNVLEDAKHFEHLIRSAKERINEWCFRWQKSDSLDDFNFNILYPISISPLEKTFSTRKDIENPNKYGQIGGEKNKILLTNSIGLITYCLELFCTTGRNDLVLKYCKELTNNKVKIELICSNLLLYGHEFNNYIKYELLKELIISTNYQNPDPYSSLSAITLLSQDKDILVKLSEESCTIDNANQDIQIAFAIITYNTDITDSYNNYISKLNQITNQNLINYSDFHRQMYEKKKTHISPIYAIKNKQRPENVRVQALNIALDKLTLHCKYLLFENGIEDRILEQIKEKACECKRYVEQYFTGNISGLADIEIIVDNLIPHIEKIHSELFIDSKNIDRFIYEKVNEVFITDEMVKEVFERYNIDCNSKPYNISDKGRDVLAKLNSIRSLPLWIPMNSKIKEYIGYLVQNIRHSESYITDYFSDPFTNETTLLKFPYWYSFDYSESERTFSILFANKIMNKENYDKANKSMRIKDFINLQLGIELKYKYIEESNILVTRLTFSII